MKRLLIIPALLVSFLVIGQDTTIRHILLDGDMRGAYVPVESTYAAPWWSRWVAASPAILYLVVVASLVFYAGGYRLFKYIKGRLA